MRNAPHLVVSISGHGFGHVAQTAPILNALHSRMPQLRLSVRSAVAGDHLRSRIHAPFTHLASVGDIGMLMSSALDVRIADSRAAYREFHAGWDERVAAEAHLLRELRADFVLTNVGYLPLAGAQRAGIPNAALCSLNWSDIYRHYCGTDAVQDHPVRAEYVARHTVAASAGPTCPADETIAAQIQSCYANADAFLRATPGMAMADLPNRVPVAPIAAVGTNRRDELERHLKLARDEKLVLISLGGIASRLPIEGWPRIDGVRWLVQQSWQARHPDAIVLEALPLGFSDLLASSDALICKPGYGSFVEAACSGVPVLYVSRADWPESPALVEWLQRAGRCREISRQHMESGNIADQLADIWDVPRPARIVPEGAAQAADWLSERLDR